MLLSRLRRKLSRRLWTVYISFFLVVSIVVGAVIAQPQLSRAQNAVRLSKVENAEVSMVSVSPKEVSDVVAETDLLTLGDRNPHVSELKQQLQQLGYETGNLNAYFNKVTEQAVFAFQQAVGIGQDGIVGEETQAALAQALAQETQTVTISPDRAQNPPDIERIINRGKLVVAVLNKENPPFFMTDDKGSLIGSDVELAQELADQLGVMLEFNRSARTFNDVVKQVYNLEADLAISKISRTLQRAKRVSFSNPYLTMRQGLLVNRVQLAEQAKGENVAEMLRTLEGRVGVIRGSSYVGFVKQKFPNATIAEFSTWPEVVKAVTQGKVLAAYRDELEVKKIVRNNPDASLQFQTIALTDTQDPLAVVLPWDSRSLQDFVNQYLDVVHPDDTVDSLLDRYFGPV
ncbi:MAG: transporter substrate-binding domain-containing protein [Cyanobacteria bacterium P01_D01_bin.105]